MSRKGQKKRKDDLCDPSLGKKQRSIAMTSLEQYHDFLIATFPGVINAVLDQLEHDIPEDVKVIRDEPFSEKSEPEQLGFMIGDYDVLINI